jgi:PKD repeat protein
MKRLVSVLSVVFVSMVAASAGAQTFTMSLLGSRESPAGDPAGRGLAVVTFNGGSVYYFLWVQNIATPMAAHIHSGTPGVAGPILVGFNPTWTNPATNTYMAFGSVSVDAGTIQSILQNPAAYYVNVHNGPFPGGALRGALLGDGPASYALATDLLGSRVPGGGSPTGQGFSAFVFDTGTLYYYLWETGIGTPTVAHVHTGQTDESGPILVGLSPTFTGGQAIGSAAVDPGTLSAIQAHSDQYYVDLHTTTYPTDPQSALRGQLNATESDANVTIAAHNPGLGTSFYKTDLRVLSLTDEPAMVYGQWFPHGVTSATGPATTVQFTIPANGESVYDDVVSTLFGASTRGAFRLLSALPFIAEARNYNDQRSSGNGTFGENSPGMTAADALTSGAMLLQSNQAESTGLGYRTNVGYFNPSSSSIDVTFNVRTPDGTLVAPPSKATIAPWSDDQPAWYTLIPGIPTGQDNLDNFYITFSATQPIYLFSSVVDNKTNDSIHQPAVAVPAALTQPVGSTQSAAPTGTITVPPSNESVTAGTPVNFQGSGTDPKGETLTVAWNFGDGGSATGYTATHTYASTGTFTVTMTVTNTDGVSDPNPPTRMVTVTSSQASNPTGTITMPASNTSAYAGYAVNFAGSGSDPKGETLTATWDFGDGGTATGFTATHTYASAGTYTVTFTVKNTDGVSDPNPPTRIITVTTYYSY